MTNVETSRMSVPGTKMGPKQSHEKKGSISACRPSQKKRGMGLAQDNNPCNPPPHDSHYQDRMQYAINKGMVDIETSCMKVIVVHRMSTQSAKWVKSSCMRKFARIPACRPSQSGGPSSGYLKV